MGGNGRAPAALPTPWMDRIVRWRRWLWLRGASAIGSEVTRPAAGA